MWHVRQSTDDKRWHVETPGGVIRQTFHSMKAATEHMYSLVVDETLDAELYEKLELGCREFARMVMQIRIDQLKHERKNNGT